MMYFDGRDLPFFGIGGGVDSVIDILRVRSIAVLLPPKALKSNNWLLEGDR